ncbi:aldose epimerase family protein [Frateuria aurantia]
MNRLQARTPHPAQGYPWGILPDRRKVGRYTLRNAQDMRVELSDLGASLLSWHAPDRQGRLADVLLGHAGPGPYAQGLGYLGAVVGRWANRIRQGRFELDGRSYPLERNDGEHHLHGGHLGFHQALWRVDQDGHALLFSLTSPDGDGGYPGQLEVQVRYTLDDDGTLSLDYRAQSSRSTPINLTAHPYFNLGGGQGDIRDHLLYIDAEQFLAVDAGMIPVRQQSVAGSAFDFRHPAPLGSRLDWPDPQLKLAGGFDHCYCLGEAKGQVREVAVAMDPASGRRLTVSTDQPGLQLYTGQHLGASPDREGGHYAPRAGFCLEAQAFPDQINSPLAERCVLRPGQIYRQRTRYRLDIA